MIWLTWRQHRVPGLVAASAIAALTVALLYVALRARQIADGAGVTLSDSLVRTQVQSEFAPTPIFGALFVLVLFLPAFIALFAGAALLAREFEERTHRLVWTQGISRERWFLAKSALIAGALALASLVLAYAALLAQPVLPPLDPTAGRFANFDIEWPAMVGWALFAFAVGTAYSALFKRSLPALLGTFMTFGALRLYILTQLRPYYIAPEQAPVGTRVPEDAWALVHRFVDASGHEADPGRIAGLVQGFSAHVAEYQGNMNRYLEDNGIFQPQLFQPADRFWSFQAIEFSLLATASVLFVFGALSLVRRVKA